jgi:D-alanyl-D-alanine carboxypeptidase
MSYPLLAKIVGARSYYFSCADVNGKLTVCFFHNTHIMIGGCCKGIKTGITANAGGCLATLWEEGGRRIIVLVLGCKDEAARFTETQKLIKFYA